MSGKLTRSAYEGLIDQNIEWLRLQPRTLEREHIETVLRASVALYYPESSRSPGCSTADRIKYLEAAEHDYQRRVLALEEGLSAIYSERGEDEFIAGICRDLLRQ